MLWGITKFIRPAMLNSHTAVMTCGMVAMPILSTLDSRDLPCDHSPYSFCESSSHSLSLLHALWSMHHGSVWTFPVMHCSLLLLKLGAYDSLKNLNPLVFWMMNLAQPWDYLEPSCGTPEVEGVDNMSELEVLMLTMWRWKSLVLQKELRHPRS